MVSKESTALTVWFQLILMDTLQSNCSVQAVFSCKCSLFIVAFNKLSVRVWTAYLGYSVCVCEFVLLSQASVQGPEGQQLLIPHFCSEASLAPVAWQPCVFRRGGGLFCPGKRKRIAWNVDEAVNMRCLLKPEHTGSQWWQGSWDSPVFHTEMFQFCLLKTFVDHKTRNVRNI